MSELIMQFHRETNWGGSRGLQRTPYRGRRQDTAMWGRPAPRPTCQPPRCYISFLPPPKLHLRRSLSRFDPRAHVVRSILYKQPCTPLPQ
jgi:hypothetical protein